MGSGGSFLEFYSIYISSEAMDLAEGVNVVSFNVLSVAKVLFSWRYWYGVVGVLLFSVDYISVEEGGEGVIGVY